METYESNIRKVQDDGGADDEGWEGKGYGYPSADRKREDEIDAKRYAKKVDEGQLHRREARERHS